MQWVFNFNMCALTEITHRFWEKIGGNSIQELNVYIFTQVGYISPKREVTTLRGLVIDTPVNAQKIK